MEANHELQATLEAEGFITVPRAARLLVGVRTQTIYRWAVVERVRSRWVGGLLFVSQADVKRELGVKEAEVMEPSDEDEKQTCRWKALNVGGHTRCTADMCREGPPRRTRQEHEADHADDDDGRGER